MERTRIYQTIRQFEDDFLIPRAETLQISGTISEFGELRGGWDHDGHVIRSRMHFFSVKCVIVTRPKQRTAVEELWRQPMVTNEGEGTVALIMHEFTGDHLIRLRAEPGNSGYVLPDGKNTHVLVGPPIQFSAPNIARSARGPELAALTREIKHWEYQCEDGGRFYEKRNRYGILRIRQHRDIRAHLEALGGAQADFAWVSHDVLIDIRRRGLMNGFLPSALSRLL
jgi:hypothetical protein